MKIKPLYDRILVRREDQEETSPGGIVLPGSAKEKSNQGEVVAVGDGAILDSGERRSMTVKVVTRSFSASIPTVIPSRWMTMNLSSCAKTMFAR